MVVKRLRFAALLLFALCVSGLAPYSPLVAQSRRSQSPLNEDPLRPRGQNVIPVFDGWFENSDDSYTLCFGYFNTRWRRKHGVLASEQNQNRHF